MIYKNLRKIRKKRKLKQTDVQRLLNNKILSCQIEQYEFGRNDFSLKNLLQFCKLYNVSADYILDTKFSKGERKFELSNETLIDYLYWLDEEDKKFFKMYFSLDKNKRTEMLNIFFEVQSYDRKGVVENERFDKSEND